jgi:hypothetical protein
MMFFRVKETCATSARIFTTLLALVCSAIPALAQQPGEQQPASGSSTAELQKAVQNPVANLISVPLQENMNVDIGPYGRNQSVLNIQPVIPMQISENWLLISRIITPIIYQPDVTQRSLGASGLGDINPTFFLSPAKAGKLIWGVGPAIVAPTATDKMLGQGKWSMGPSVVVLVQPGPWTIGGLVNNVWSFAGQSGRPDVNQMLFQYFINYNLEKGWFLSSSPIITANWKAANGNQWVVPVGGGVGRVFRLGPQPVSAQVQVYGNAVRPSTIPSSPWGVRFQLNFLYPTKK